MSLLWTAFLCLPALSLLAWLALLLHPARPWEMRPVGDERAPPPGPKHWPPLAVLVPARNEAQALPETLPALLAQDYPGPFHVVLIDDRSGDATAEVARRLAREAGLEERLTVRRGQALPEGWVGKVWALEQGVRHCEEAEAGGKGKDGGAAPEHPESGIPPPQYFLLTDADIRHAPGSLRRLAAESEADGLALNSRMARLRCASRAERLLIPPFVFFFNLLYPMRWVNRPGRSTAAAAGGCILLSREALRQAGGFSAIRGALIDDVSLARKVKAAGLPIRLSLSRSDVQSLRAYDSLGAVWEMVRRTAFTELKCRWWRLAGCLVLLALLFALPPAAFLSGAFLSGAALAGLLPDVPLAYTGLGAAMGLLAWALMSRLYRPASAFFGLSGAWSWSLPLAGCLYGAMTFDSACRHLVRAPRGWR